MLGTVGWVALWMLAATPPGTTISIGHQSDVMPATFQDQSPPASERADDEAAAPVPPPKRLPRDPAYEDKAAATDEGIPGLQPPADQIAEPPKDAPKHDAAKPPGTAPNPLPKPLKQIPVPLRSLPRHAAPPGEATSTDEGVSLATDQYSCNSAAACQQCVPPTRLRCWLDGVAWEGWLDQGATINTLSPRDRINGPVTFNNRSNDYQLNQLYARLKRDVDTECGRWDLGGRIDFLYGTDSIYTEARGLETFDDFSPKWNAQQLGAALPQCYMEAFCPWGAGLDMKIGHFYAPIGYESVPATNNFFYSHSYTYQYGEPFTFTGLLGTTKLGDFTIQAGMTRGWDNWEDNNNDLGFVGGIHWTSANERTDIALGVTAGYEQPDPSTNVRTLYSLVIQQKIGDRWQYVFQHDFGDEDGAGVGGSIAQWYGINQYLFYTINDCWKAGLRFEWFYDGNGSRVRIGDVPVGQTGTYYELTAGVNWTPNKHVIVRPEFRWDFTGTPDLYPFGDDTRSNQVLVDCDVIVRF